MERICNFDLSHIIDILTTTYRPNESGSAKSARSEKAGRTDEPQRILADLRQCQRLVQMTSQGLAHGFNAYG
jgi:hypothetical protein